MEEIKEAVRWNIKVSKETDLTLRTYLGARGMKKGDLSKFIEEAVRWRIFNRTVQQIKARNAGADPGELQDRKSTRLNSSHDQISYAVFCLKKKKKYADDNQHDLRQYIAA